MSTAAAVIYTTRPNYEKKGIAELEQHGVSAFTAYDETGKRAKVTAPGYIFANRRANAAFLRHVRGKPMGYASLADIGNLYVRKPERRAEEENPFTVGHKAYRGEVSVTIDDVRGRSCIISWEMLGKRMTQAIHYTQLRPG
jgi:hypothetical protein